MTVDFAALDNTFSIIEGMGPRSTAIATVDKVNMKIQIFGLPPLRHSQLHIEIYDVVRREPLKSFRRVSDFHTFTQYQRKQCLDPNKQEMPIGDIETLTGEIAHSYYGNEYGWWEGQSFVFNMFDALRLLPVDFLQYIFAVGAHIIVSVNYTAARGSDDQTRSHNDRSSTNRTRSLKRTIAGGLVSRDPPMCQ